MIPLYEIGGKSTTVLGFPVNQNRLALPFWSYAMEVHPPKQIIELGAYNGGFTTLLGIHAWRIGAKIYSYDVQECPNRQWRDLSEFLGIRFIKGDIFQRIEEIASLIKRAGVSYVLCDNGNKVKEFNIFADHLKPGDIIAAHDYFVGNHDWWGWEEIRQSDVADAVGKHGLEPFMQEHFDMVGWLVYKKRQHQ